ncbi:DUF2180 family protein [Streptomyces sp. NPDC048385]|uniref:DUF2180 family protein n=1 Tax=unclassified Streptomyces TaxID=2593676 RepID=UPI003416FF34
MNCYDCQITDEATAAVALCSVCGAGLCGHHAHLSPHVLHRLNGLGLAARPRAARRFLCDTCREAEGSG